MYLENSLNSMLYKKKHIKKTVFIIRIQSQINK
jgi:hypothetical protein